MTQHDELLARLDHVAKAYVPHSPLAKDAAAALRDLSAKLEAKDRAYDELMRHSQENSVALEAERKAREEAERQTKDWMAREEIAQQKLKAIDKDYKQVCNWLICCAKEMNLRAKEYEDRLK